MQMRSGLISIGKLDTIASPRGPMCTFESTLHFLVSRGNIELKTSKHEFTDIIHQNKQGFEGKKLRGTNFTAFQQNVCQTIAYSGNLKQKFLLFSYLYFRVYFACYPPESSKIICLTCIWSKFVDTSFHSSQKPREILPDGSAIFTRFEKIVSWSSKLLGSWNLAHNWLNLLTSCGPNLEAIGRNTIFCECW